MLCPARHLYSSRFRVIWLDYFQVLIEYFRIYVRFPRARIHVNHFSTSSFCVVIPGALGVVSKSSVVNGKDSQVS